MPQGLFEDDPAQVLERAIRLVREIVVASPSELIRDQGDPSDGVHRFDLRTTSGLGVALELTMSPGLLRLVVERGPLAAAGPGNEVARLRSLLRGNATHGGLAFALSDRDEVLLVGARPLRDLDASELLALLAEVDAVTLASSPG